MILENFYKKVGMYHQHSFGAIRVEQLTSYAVTQITFCGNVGNIKIGFKKKFDIYLHKH